MNLPEKLVIKIVEGLCIGAGAMWWLDFILRQFV